MRPVEKCAALALVCGAAALACGLADVFRSSGVESVMITYTGDTVLHRDSTVPFGVVVTAGGTDLQGPHLDFASSDTNVFVITAGRDSLFAKKVGSATLTIRLESSIVSDSAPTLVQALKVLP
jgi:hypothetical protein